MKIPFHFARTQNGLDRDQIWIDSKMAEDVGFVLQYIYHPTHREKEEVLYKMFPNGWTVSLPEQVTLRVYQQEFWGPQETLDEMMEYIRGVYEHLKERKIIGDFRLTLA